MIKKQKAMHFNSQTKFKKVLENPVHTIKLVHPKNFYQTLGCTIHPVEKHSF